MTVRSLWPHHIEIDSGLHIANDVSRLSTHGQSFLGPRAVLLQSYVSRRFFGSFSSRVYTDVAGVDAEHCPSADDTTELARFGSVNWTAGWTGALAAVSLG